MANPITIRTTVDAPIEKVWEDWNGLEHISGWASPDPETWGATAITNDVRNGGTFKTKMFAKDNSAGFDFEGTYTAVKEPTRIEYTLTDGRHVSIAFKETPEGVEIVETFDPENENPKDFQRAGWQAILDNFKKYVEGSK
jgi:uncharacterized protein YndB with AHSA1/START domain